MLNQYRVAPRIIKTKMIAKFKLKLSNISGENPRYLIVFLNELDFMFY